MSVVVTADRTWTAWYHATCLMLFVAQTYACDKSLRLDINSICIFICRNVAVTVGINHKYGFVAVYILQSQFMERQHFIVNAVTSGGNKLVVTCFLCRVSTSNNSVDQGKWWTVSRSVRRRSEVDHTTDRWIGPGNISVHSKEYIRNSIQTSLHNCRRYARLSSSSSSVASTSVVI